MSKEYTYPFHWTEGAEANAYIETLFAKIDQLEQSKSTSLALLEKDIKSDLYEAFVFLYSSEITPENRAKIYTDRIMAYVKEHLIKSPSRGIQ